MTGFREQLLILIGTPLYLIIIGVELLLGNYRYRKLYTWRDTAANVYLMLANSLIELVIRGFYLGLLVYIYEHRLFQFMHPVVYWSMLLILEDFIYYLEFK